MTAITLPECLQKNRQKTVNCNYKNVGYKNLQSMQLPTNHQEAWKYTNLRFLRNTDYVINDEIKQSVKIKKSTAEDKYEIILSANNTLYLDEKIAAIADKFDQDFYIGSIADYLQKYGHNNEIIKKVMTNNSDIDNYFANISLAHFNQGLIIILPEDYVLTKPMHLITQNSCNKNTWNNFHAIIYLHKNAQLSLHENYIHEETEYLYLNNMFFHINLSANSHFYQQTLLNYRLKQYKYLRYNNVVQHKDSNYNHCNLQLAANFYHQETKIYCQEKSSNSNIYGFAIPRTKHYIDNNFIVNHLSNNGTSAQKFYNIVEAHGTAVFNGQVNVYKNAKQNDAQQLNKNILLNESATVYAKPSLIVDNDDVKCAHGATVGFLDKDILRYFMLRGLPENIARKLLIEGFIQDILQDMQDADTKQFIMKNLNIT